MASCPIIFTSFVNTLSVWAGKRGNHIVYPKRREYHANVREFSTQETDWLIFRTDHYRRTNAEIRELCQIYYLLFMIKVLKKG